MLRRVAIVLSNLPTQTAEQLLGSFDSQSAASLNRAVNTLADVDPMEQKRAMEAFRVSIQTQPNAAGSMNPQAAGFERSTQEANPSLTSPRFGSVHAAAGPAQSASVSSSNSPIVKEASAQRDPGFSPSHSTSSLAFLGSVPKNELVELLAAEHPQAITLVLASIDPEIAAEVLSGLPDPLRAQTVSRIGRLSEIPPDVALDLAGHFQAKLRERQTSDLQSNGKRTLAAIMAAMPQTQQDSLNQDQPSSIQPVATPTHPMPVRSVPSHQASLPLHLSPIQKESGEPYRSEAESASEDLSSRLRVVSDSEMGTRSSAASEMDRYADTTDQIHSYQDPAKPESYPRHERRFDSTDEIHQYLQSLEPMELCQALGKVETRDAMLALCGLPSDVAESALGVLPSEQANSVRIKMASLNQINLRDIDDAKERVAMTAQGESHATSESNERLESVPLAA